MNGNLSSDDVKELRAVNRNLSSDDDKELRAVNGNHSSDDVKQQNSIFMISMLFHLVINNQRPTISSDHNDRLSILMYIQHLDCMEIQSIYVFVLPIL